MDPDLEEAERDVAQLTSILHEWYEYWRTNDHMPAKMPGSLHVRTAMALTCQGVDVMGDAHQKPETCTAVGCDAPRCIHTPQGEYCCGHQDPHR